MVHIWVNVSCLTSDFMEHLNPLIYRLNIYNCVKQNQVQSLEKTPRKQGVTSPLATPCHCSATASSPAQWCFSVTGFSRDTPNSACVFSSIFGQLLFLSRAGSGCYLSVQGAHWSHFRQTPELCYKCLGQVNVCDCGSFKYCLWCFAGLCRNHIFLSVLKYFNSGGQRSDSSERKGFLTAAKSKPHLR